MMFRVTDLDRSIKYYTECLGMKHLRSRDNEKARRPTRLDLRWLVGRAGLPAAACFGAPGHFAIPVCSAARVLRYCEGCA